VLLIQNRFFQSSLQQQNGPRVRLAAVFTDIENLPFSQQNPHAWIRDYCQNCNICVHKCPANAIYQETKTHIDLGPEFIDHTKCALPFSNDNGCTLCIKYCPFSYVDYEKLQIKQELKPVVM
jgi:epoxyqueuosine reductase QueG